MKIRKLAPLLVAIVLVGILISQIKLSDIFYALKNISPIWLFFGFTLYIIGYFFRALRFHILLDREISIKELFWIVSLHNMANNLLPARAGEVSYVYLIKRRGHPHSEGVATLIIARVFDLMAISIIFFISLFLIIAQLPPSFAQFSLALAFIMFAVVVLLYLVTYRGRESIRIIERVAMKIGIRKRRFFSYLSKELEDTQREFQIIKSKRLILNVFLASILVWGFNYLLIYALINDVGIRMGIWGALFCNTFAVLTTILPVQGIGGFGTREGGWTIGFILLGVSRDIAIASSFAIHITVFFYFLILGVVALIRY